ncbi:GNAT family N-acetyltransferase [Massilia rhizosphaerae]|uniref:GNAT family N-acetyltransferase n=1 Tax=Massilia rhizosphaerae TaxID=2784389 RepID=UPI0018DEA53D|nr:GNAT family N-acetyltransferase [Massilia rhizosphaerae]
MSVAEDIKDLLVEVDNDFTPRLSVKLDFDVYCRKIAEKAVLFTVYEAGKISGLVAVYCNDSAVDSAFVTMVAVRKSARSTGLGSALLRSSFAYAAKAGFKTMRLEIYKTNPGLRSFYGRLGFTVASESDVSVFMELDLFSHQSSRLGTS